MPNIIRQTAIVLFTAIAMACNNQSPKTLFTLVEESGIDFTNQLTESDDFNVFKYRNFYNGGGVATGDLNNDGLPDIFFTANQGPNKLYLNKGAFVFEDISEKAGIPIQKKEWSTGVVFVDINQDGWLDIYVCNAGNMMDPALRRNQLYINNRDLTFTESAREYGLDNDGYTTQASFFDYDLDGDLDCFMVNNSPIPVNTLNYANMRDKPESEWGVKDFLKGGGDHLYKNEQGRFIEVTREAGIHGGLISLGLGVNVGDINGDGYPDIYVSNDFFERDYLYVNQRDGRFKDELESRVRHTSLSSMGADIHDINNDGFPDFFTTDMLPSDPYRLKANTTFDHYDVFKLKQNLGFFNQYTQNALLVNNGLGHFWETAYYSGVAASDWSWGALIFDADNDGRSDIFVCNGIYRDVTDQDFIDFFSSDIIQQMILTGKKEEVSKIIDRMPSNPIPNQAYKNEGALKFSDAIKDWGFEKPSFSNGAAYADLDNDGDLDLIVNNVNQPAFLYRNNTNELKQHHYLTFQLQFTGANPFAVGSVVKVYSGTEVRTREIIPSRGFQSSVEYKQTFGLGTHRVDSVVIQWPNLHTTVLYQPRLDTLHSVVYDVAQTKTDHPYTINAVPYFNLVSHKFDRHQEDEYVDFYYERNIPFMLSRQGPKLAIGDVNDDGLEDLFVGGAKDQPSQLYIQTATGFIKKTTPDFATFSFNDVTAAQFFDCDGDGDLDLFMGGGGNFASTGFQNQLFINDGKGGFQLQRGALPISNTNCGTVLAFDYDQDGDLDLFIGSRSVPQSYGITPQSFLWKNDGKGHFVDVTATEGAALAALGMITGAAYAHLGADQKPTLVISGEWMSPTLLEWTGRRFELKKTNGLDSLLGWWQTLKLLDVDQDGDLDLVLGNLGTNFYLQARHDAPVKLWIKDFDNNGSPEKIFSHTIGGRDIPVFSKREITDQIPSLKKQNLKHHEYATKSIQDIFGVGLQDAGLKMIREVRSGIAYNNGAGNFAFKPFPMRAQLSSVNAIVSLPLAPGKAPAIVLAGNTVSLLPQFGALDAHNGLVLVPDGKGEFMVLKDAATGLHAMGETRDAAVLQYQATPHLLFLQNNDYPLFYRLNLP